MLKRLCFSAALAAAALVTNRVRANSVELTFIGVTVNGSNYDWHYTATLTPDNYVTTGDTVTFFDFDGFVSGSFTPDPLIGGPSYAFTAYNDAPVQPVFVGETGPAGDLSTGDVQFTYNGVSPYLLGPLSSAPGDVFLGAFTLTSQYFTGARDVVVTTDTSAGADLKIGTADDVPNMVTRLTDVARGGGFPEALPVPMSAWGGVALMGGLGIVRLRRVKAALAV